MKWYLFTLACFAYSGEPVCTFDLRMERTAFRTEALCERAAGLLGQAVADIGGRQLAYMCAAAPNLDAALLTVLGQRRA